MHSCICHNGEKEKEKSGNVEVQTPNQQDGDLVCFSGFLFSFDTLKKSYYLEVSNKICL